MNVYSVKPESSSLEKIIVEAERCESHQCWHFYASDEAVDLLRDVLKKVGVGFVIEARPGGLGYMPSDSHRMRAAIDSVFEVQGMKRVEGQEVVGAIERLVAEYAKLK